MPAGKLTNLSLWSTTPASNATVGSITWAEGQAPSTVNDSSRQEMADTRSWYETAQWIDYGYSISYVSTTVFKFHDANRTSLAEVNRRVRAGVGAGTIYGLITDTTFSTSDTQVTVSWDSGQLDASLSYVALGIITPTQGAGVPFSDSFPVVVGATNRTKKVRFEVDGLTTATTRVVTVPDQDFTLNTTGALASGRNIASRTNSVTPNTKFDITADEIILKDTSNNIFVARSVNVTVDFAGTGANGIDTGTQQASTWYYGWVIAKADGTIAGLGSTSNSAPTMPSGYVYKALVTAVRSDGSTQFIKYRQVGNKIYFESAQNVLNSAVVGTTETTVSLSSFVPPNALEANINAYGQATASGAGPIGSTAVIRVISGSTYSSAQISQTTSNASAFGYVVNVENVSQQIFVLFGNATNFANSTYIVDVLGFKLPLGGE